MMSFSLNQMNLGLGIDKYQYSNFVLYEMQQSIYALFSMM